MAARSPYRRVILKMSGELFGRRKGLGLDERMLCRVAGEVKQVHDLGVGLGVVAGAGNFLRGGRNDLCAVRRTSADDIGMLAALINSIALRDHLLALDVPARVLSAVDAPKMVQRFSTRLADECFRRTHYIA